MFFSVIIPVYNTDAWLDDCIASVTKGGFDDFELILVDDGSTDKSGAICDAWAERDSRVRVLHQANRGFVAARNHGLEKAEGTYITFMDSDDTVKPDYLSTIHACAVRTRADIICFGLEKVRDGEVVETNCLDDFTVHGAEALRPYFMQFFYTHMGSVCVKAYRRELLARHHLMLDNGPNENGDILFDMKVVPKAASIVNIGQVFYVYRQHDDSISRSGQDDMLAVFEVKMRRLKLFMEEMGYEEMYEPLYKDQQIGFTYSQFLQAVLPNQMGYAPRAAAIKKLYKTPGARALLAQRFSEGPRSLSATLCRLSIGLRWPFVAAFPAAVRVFFLRRRRSTP